MKEREEKLLSVRAQCLPGAIPLFGAWVLLVIALVNIYRLGRRKYTFLFYLCWCVPAFLFYAAAALAVCLSKISAAEQTAAFLLMVLGVFCAACRRGQSVSGRRNCCKRMRFCRTAEHCFMETRPRGRKEVLPLGRDFVQNLRSCVYAVIRVKIIKGLRRRL